MGSPDITDNSPYASLTEHVLRGGAGGFERKVWTMASGGETPRAVILFLDGELYVERVEAPRLVRRLEERGIIPPALAAFVSHGDPAARHADFACRPDYADFIAYDVAGRLVEMCPTTSTIVIAGLSLSGLAAAYIATRHAAPFRAAICQSPSFWWEDGRFGAELPESGEHLPPLWISVGSQETEAGVHHPPTGLFQAASQVYACERTCAALRARGREVCYRVFEGGHDPECWRDDLERALPWACRRA